MMGSTHWLGRVSSARFEFGVIERVASMAARSVPQMRVSHGLFARFSSDRIESSHDTLSAASKSFVDDTPARRRNSRVSRASAGAAAYSIRFVNLGDDSRFCRFVDIVGAMCRGTWNSNFVFSVPSMRSTLSGAEVFVRALVDTRGLYVFAGYFPEVRGVRLRVGGTERPFCFRRLLS